MTGPDGWSPRLDRQLDDLRERYPDLRKTGGGWSARGVDAPTLDELAERLAGHPPVPGQVP